MCVIITSDRLIAANVTSCDSFNNPFGSVKRMYCHSKDNLMYFSYDITLFSQRPLIGDMSLDTNELPEGYIYDKSTGILRYYRHGYSIAVTSLEPSKMYGWAVMSANESIKNLIKVQQGVINADPVTIMENLSTTISTVPAGIPIMQWVLKPNANMSPVGEIELPCAHTVSRVKRS